MKEADIRNYWNAHPCGEQLVGETAKYTEDHERFFSRYDQFRYRTESHIPRCLDAIDFKGKEVLEIGLGEGSESEQIIRRGGNWSGLDLTPESVSRVRTRLLVRGLPYRALKEGSALEIPFPENSFDIVFSHGVLHHVPEIRTAQREIHRVLRPEGELIVMLYAKWSLNYLVSIGILRRMGLMALYLTKAKLGGLYDQHVENARKSGLWRYLRMRNFIHRNTDGPLNPYSKVYDLSVLRADFPDFTVVRSYKRFMHAPPLQVGRLPLERMLGWHLWVHLKPKKG